MRPVAGPVPPTVAGKKTSEAMKGPVGGGMVVMVAERITPPASPVMTAKSVAVVGRVVTLKTALAVPAGTVTDAGTVATVGVLLVNVTTVAAPLADASVTVPCTTVPPTTSSDARVNDV